MARLTKLTFVAECDECHEVVERVHDETLEEVLNESGQNANVAANKFEDELEAQGWFFDEYDLCPKCNLVRIRATGKGNVQV